MLICSQIAKKILQVLKHQGHLLIKTDSLLKPIIRSDYWFVLYKPIRKNSTFANCSGFTMLRLSSHEFITKNAFI